MVNKNGSSKGQRLRIWFGRNWFLVVACATVSVAALIAVPVLRHPILEVPVGLLALTATILVLWQVPKLQVPTTDVDRLAAAKLENANRQTLVQALGGLFVLLGLAFTWQTVRSTYLALEIAERGQRAERFSKAVDLLGKDKPQPQVTAGAIYALEQLARDSPSIYHQSVMEILTAYIRHVASWKESGAEQQTGLAPVDIQAAITAITRRVIANDTPGQPLQLRYVDLRRIVLIGDKIRFANVDLIGAHMEWARLKGVDMKNATLDEVHFEDARLRRANFEGATLENAVLDRATLQNANFQGACLVGASLKGANLKGADLRGTIGLTQEQLNSAVIDSSTMFQIPSSPAKKCP